MKSTYKLLGVIYDKLPETIHEYIVSLNDDTISDISLEKNIFEVDEYVRKINLSYLFSIESKETLDLILAKASRLDKVVLVIDVSTDNRITKDFIQKRVKQILWLLENTCRNIELVI